MKQSIDNVEMLQLLEKKQKLLLGIKVAITLDRMDLVRKLSVSDLSDWGCVVRER